MNNHTNICPLILATVQQNNKMHTARSIVKRFVVGVCILGAVCILEICCVQNHNSACMFPSYFLFRYIFIILNPLFNYGITMFSVEKLDGVQSSIFFLIEKQFFFIESFNSSSLY